MNEKITAWALKELPADERAAVEAALDENQELRAEALEVQSFCELLDKHFPRANELTHGQRAKVLAAFDGAPAEQKIVRPRWPRAIIATAGLAACLTAGVMLINKTWFTGKSGHARTESASAPNEHAASDSGGESGDTSNLLATTTVKLGEALETRIPSNAPADIGNPDLLDGKKVDLAQTFSEVTANEFHYGYDVRSASDSGQSASRGFLGGAKSLRGFDYSESAPAEVASASATSPTGPASLTPLASNVDSLADATSGETAGEKNLAALTPDGTVATAESLPVESKFYQLAGTTAGTVPSKGMIVDDGFGGAPAADLSVSRFGDRANTEGFSYGNTPVVEAARELRTAHGPIDGDGSRVAQSGPNDPLETRTRDTGATALYAKDTHGTTAGGLISGPGQVPAPGTPPASDAYTVELSKAKQVRDHVASNESYTRIVENPFLFVLQAPLSTFSIDVDTASYANVRRFLNAGSLPPPDAVRLEELINYFPYQYEPPGDGKPFAVTVDVADAPWQPEHRLARVALKGREIKEDRGPANFVFLVDVSGSMDEPAKHPLVQQSLLLLTEQLRGSDYVGIVTYAGESGVALPSTSMEMKDKIKSCISSLRPGGSTNGASGIRLAYEQAARHFKPGGVNRVILCTDGDFNVGVSSPEELEKLITEKAKSGVFLSVLGYGTGNLKDRTMETLADKGNGNYAYIDSLSEARKVLVEQMSGTLVTIAKDVKIQVEFNPAQVAAYRLLGYENRALAKEDFNDDKKDAGEIGAGHTVTALYEIVPAGLRHPAGLAVVDDLKYQQNKVAAPAPAAVENAAAQSRELLTVKLRYKLPEADVSVPMDVPVTDGGRKLADSPRDFQFAAAVTGFGMMLRGSHHRGGLTWDMVRNLALAGKGDDPQGWRGEFIQLIEKARGMAR